MWANYWRKYQIKSQLLYHNVKLPPYFSIFWLWTSVFRPLLPFDMLSHKCVSKNQHIRSYQVFPGTPCTTFSVRIDLYKTTWLQINKSSVQDLYLPTLKGRERSKVLLSWPKRDFQLILVNFDRSFMIFYQSRFAEESTGTIEACSTRSTYVT